MSRKYVSFSRILITILSCIQSIFFFYSHNLVADTCSDIFVRNCNVQSNVRNKEGISLCIVRIRIYPERIIFEKNF